MSRGKLLEPLTGVVGAVVVLSLGLALPAVISRIAALVTDPVCVTTWSWPFESRTSAPASGLAPGVVLEDLGQARLCVVEPAPWQQALSLLTDIPGPVAQVGGLLLFLRLLKRAARFGVHTTDTADDLRGLGYYLMFALPAAALVESISRSTLVHAAVTYDAGWGLFFGDWRIPWWAVLTGLGLLSLAKVVHTGAEMRAELEGTV